MPLRRPTDPQSLGVPRSRDRYFVSEEPSVPMISEEAMPRVSDRPVTDDVRILDVKELAAPSELLRDLPIPDGVADRVAETRLAISRILAGEDPRLLVVIGPCAVHDVAATLEYASWLADIGQAVSRQLLLLMRVYFEKPRARLGWKGLINDPYLDGSFKINDGLRMARHLLLDLAEMEVPAGTEFLDMISPQYIAGLASWGAIGARPTESQVHRQRV